MNFDRKFGNIQPKPAEQQADFAALPLPADEGAPPQNAAAYPKAYHNPYPSGAFPALNLAYPEQNIQNSAGAFTSAKDFSANSGQSGYNGGAEGFAQNQPRANQPIYAPYPQEAGQSNMPRGHDAEQNAAQNYYDAAAGGEDMTGRRYKDAERDSQPSRGSGGAHDASYAESPRRSDGQNRQNPNAAAPEFYEGGAPQGDFAEQAFRGDFPVQPAHFDPSDYDYAYNPDEAAPQAAAAPNYGGAHNSPPPAYAPHEQEGSAAYYDAPPPPQNYAPQQGYAEPGYDYAPREQGFAEAAEAGGESRYAPQGEGFPQNEEGDVAAMFAPEGGYNGADYQEQNPDYGAYDYSGAPPPPQEEMPRQFYPDSYQNADFADDSPLPFETPYAQEDDAAAADYERLNADIARMEGAASAEPLAGGAAAEARLSGHNAPFAAQAEQSYAEDNFYGADAMRGQNRPREPRGGADERAEFGAAPGGADKAYDDGFYDWAAPAAAEAAAAPLSGALRAPRQKSRKPLYISGILLLCVIAAAAFAYLFYGRASLGLGSNEPVVIHRDGGDYKVKPQNSGQSAADLQEQSVTDGVSGGSAEAQQKSLIDSTEQPVEMQKMEERLPLEEQKPFDQSAVDSLIKTVAAQASPIHIIPGVRVDSDRKITAASAGGETVLLPGEGIAGFAAAQSEAAAPASAGMAETGAAPAASAAAIAAPPAGGVKEKTFAAAKPAAPPDKPQKIAALPPKAQTAAAGGGSFFMQISSQPSREAAEQSLRAAKKYLDPAIAAKMTIISAVIPEKGTYYRVRIPAESREEAGRLCEEYKQAGGHCFVAR